VGLERGDLAERELGEKFGCFVGHADLEIRVDCDFDAIEFGDGLGLRRLE
jgi:hypothetical protein